MHFNTCIGLFITIEALIKVMEALATRNVFLKNTDGVILTQD